MKRKLFALSLGFAGLIFATNNAFAGVARCADHDGMVRQLGTSFGETRRAIGLAADNGVIEIFVSDKSGTWTITLTRPGEETCMIASGENYQPVAEALPIPGSDT